MFTKGLKLFIAHNPLQFEREKKRERKNVLLLCVAGNANISTYIFTVSLKIPTLKADTLKQNFSNIGRKDKKREKKSMQSKIR